MKIERINLLIIGVGPNADKAYLPAIQGLREKVPVTLSAIVDINEARADVVKRLRKRGFDPDAVRQIYLRGLTKNGKLSAQDTTHLDNVCRELSINAVIISTDPLAHKAYALWAMQRNLPVLMDKPIVARKNTAHSPYAARALYKDYLEILEAYQQSTAPVFSVSAQRRYHPGFQFVFDKLTEIRDKFNIPVTGMQSLHADGQWRLPGEVITQNYHPYNIYGKVSHSGYHFIDVLAKIIKLSYGPAMDKNIDQLGVMTSFVEPQGLLNQLTQDDYARIFGPEYRKVSPLSTSDLHQAYAGFGEVDVATIIQLISKNSVVANFTLNLVHNSFSRRSWLMPGEDLYKGNGRVKHEYHSIYQGPFQNIQIHSYQKDSTFDPKGQNNVIGGGSHFDVYVFRNADITGSKPLEIYTLHDIIGEPSKAEEINMHDQIKFSMAEEFFDFLLGNITQTELVSDLSTHQLSALMMSLIYQAHNAQRLVKYRLHPDLLG